MEEILVHLNKRYRQAKDKIGLKAKQEELDDLNEAMLLADFWSDPSKAAEVSQKAKWLEQYVSDWQQIISGLETLPEMLKEADETEKEMFVGEVDLLSKKFDQLEVQLFLAGEYDDHNAIVSLHVGNGGQDAEDFTQILQRMYLRYAEIYGFKAEIIDESKSDAGLRSCTLKISGPFAFGYLKTEHGVHRLIRLSPFNSASLRQTSFARVEVLPELSQTTDIEIDPSDLRIDVFRSSGAGGQSVNTTDSAVRITYLPLNVVVNCQNERSQQQNKETAMGILKGKLVQLKLEQNAAEINEIRGDKMEANFGSQIKTYTLQPYQLVKDHRNDYEEGNPQKVFDGEIQGFIEAQLRT